MVGDLFVTLGIDKGECLKHRYYTSWNRLKEVEKGGSSAASFIASVREVPVHWGMVEVVS